LLQGICPFKEPICVEIPSGETVSVLSSVLPRIKSHRSIKINAPAGHATAMTTSRLVSDREKALLMAKVNAPRPTRQIRIIARNFGELFTPRKKNRTISILVNAYLIVVEYSSEIILQLRILQSQSRQHPD
jgi:hypothetical protein